MFNFFIKTLSRQESIVDIFPSNPKPWRVYYHTFTIRNYLLKLVPNKKKTLGLKSFQNMFVMIKRRMIFKVGVCICD